MTEPQLIPMPDAKVRMVRERHPNSDPHWVEWYYVQDETLESGWRGIGCKVVPNPFYVPSNPELRPDGTLVHPLQIDMSGLSMIWTVDPTRQPNLTKLAQELQGHR